MPLENRSIKVEIILDHGTFREGYNTKIITGDSTTGSSFRIQIEKAGGFARDNAELTIYGMNEDDQSILSTLSYQPNEIRRNKIIISAGYNGEYVQYFAGEIMTANAIYADPSRAFHILAVAALFAGIDIAPHTNNPGTVSVAKLLQTLCTGAGLTLKNTGVILNSKNYIATGSYIDQIRSICDDFNLVYRIDNNVLSVAPQGIPLENTLVILNAGSGLLSYPTVDQNGVHFRCRFDPNIKFGNKVRIQSIVPKASGDWGIYSIQTALENRHEKWEISASGSLYAFGI